MPVCLSRSGCHPLSPVRLPFSVSLSVARCLPLSVSPSPCVPARSCLSVCLSVCICLAPSWECVSEPSSLSVSVSPDPRPPTGAMAVALAAALAPAGCLTWRGCLRVSVCLSVCLHVVRLLPPEGPVLGGRRGGKGGLGRAKGRGGRALGSPRWWLQVALGTGQVPGRMGAQGHGWAAHRPAGGSEDRGPQRAPKPESSGATWP